MTTSYDQSFATIALVRGLLVRGDVVAAQRELERRRASGDDASIATLLQETGKLERTDIEVVEAAMKRHAFTCGSCQVTSYLLPKQAEADVRCDKCGGVPKRARTAPTSSRMPVAEPVPEPRAVMPRNAFDAPMPPPVQALAGARNPFELVSRVPRVAWVACAVVMMFLGSQPMRIVMKYSGWNQKIKVHLIKLKEYQWDVRGETIKIFKADGIDIRPEDIQIAVYQDVKKDAHFFGYVTINAPVAGISMQVSQNISSREVVENTLAMGYLWVKDDRSQIWPDPEQQGGRVFSILIFFTLAMMFVVMAVRFGGR